MIFHIDVNSAFLSWSAVYNLKNGKKIDLRTVPSVIGGDSAKRHGIVVAKSIPAKKFNIKTGDTISMALQKCPNIIIEPPIHKIYNEYSKKFIAFVKHYFDIVEQASIDECYVDVPYISKEEAKKIAIFIKDKIKHRPIEGNAKKISFFQSPPHKNTLQRKNTQATTRNTVVAGRIYPQQPP